jgi:hypothetical protein
MYLYLSEAFAICSGKTIWRPKPELLTVTDAVEPQPGFGTGGAAQLHFQNPNRHELANRGMEPLIDAGRTQE